jgi:hypothetical protein
MYRNISLIIHYIYNKIHILRDIQQVNTFSEKKRMIIRKEMNPYGDSPIPNSAECIPERMDILSG